jgi:hypothetical protein
MTRATGIAGGFVVALALAPVSADAQTTISACVNNNSGTIHIVAQGTPCQNGEMPLTWSAGGTLAARDFGCLPQQLTAAGQLITFDSGFGASVNFGSSISAPPIMLQPGIYQINFEAVITNGGLTSVAFLSPFPQYILYPVNVASPTSPNSGMTRILGDRLFVISQNNTPVKIETSGTVLPNTQLDFCYLSITQLQ